MKIVIDDLAKQTLINVYYFNFKYSPRNAIEFNKRILSRIHFHILVSQSHSYRIIMFEN